MKKHIFFLGLMSAATLTLTNCTKEIDQPVSPEKQGYPFEIFASNIDVKTSNEGLTTSWEKNDGLSVFHAENGLTDLGSNDKFVITEENLPANKFTGELTNALEAGKSYDWYVIYPYNAKYSKSDEGKVGYTTYGSTCLYGEAEAQKQVGNSNMLHICGENYPVYGSVTDVTSSAKVAMEMRHLSSIVKVSVTNNSTAPIIVSEILFTAPEKIAGTFYYGVADGTYTVSNENYTSNTARLAVEKGDEIEVGKSADFYMGIVPFSVSNGALTLSVRTSLGTQEKTLNIGAQTVEFKAGKIKTLNFNLTAPEVPTIPFPWNEDFSDNSLSNYAVKKGGTETQLKNEKLAGGEAPEILISSGGGYLETNIDMNGKNGNFTLSFLSNHADYITVSSKTENVLIEKSTDFEYIFTVPQGVEKLNICLENKRSSNTRVDNISFTEGGLRSQILSFEKASCQFYLGSDEANAFTGQDVIGAQTTVTYSSDNASVASVDPSTGKVTLGSVAGTATITATAAALSSYKEATATYEIVVEIANEGEFTDVLNRDLIGVSSYQDWSGKSSKSSAEYAGNSSGGNGSIQLRSDNSNSGIVTTVSGGKVKKVVVTWNANTKDGRTLNIYGKNSAYTAATNLYDEGTQGTLLGTIVKGTSTELIVKGDYQYIGMRSSSGAMYITEIKIVWSTK